jgi:hypothetical protein
MISIGGLQIHHRFYAINFHLKTGRAQKVSATFLKENVA